MKFCTDHWSQRMDRQETPARLDCYAQVSLLTTGGLL